MIPILFDITETAFATNGIGRLYDCTRVEVTEERNGIYECEFDVPVNGAHYDEIICGRYIAVSHDDTGEIQPFEIYGYSKPIQGVTTFKAYHISYKQRNMVVNNGTAIHDIQDAFTMLRGAVPSNPFEYETDIESTNYMSGAEGAPKTVRQLLGGVEGSVLDAYGGEYEWDKWTVKLWEHRGIVKDYTIRYGVNMVDFQDEADYSGTYNAVVPYWSGQDDYGNEVIVKGSMITTDAVMYDDTTACIPLDLTDKFEEQPTVADLELMASSWLGQNKPTLPQQTITVDFIRLQDSEEYAIYSGLQDCQLCDSIRVVFPRYGMDATYKIVKTVWDALLERYTEMELGALGTSLASALGESSGGSSLTNQPTGIIDAGTNGIWSWRKWADGTAECWGTVTGSVSSWTKWGSLYYSTRIGNQTFPNGLFNAVPSLNATVQGCAQDVFLCINGETSSSQTCGFYLMRPANASSASYTIGLYAKGKWK